MATPLAQEGKTFEPVAPVTKPWIKYSVLKVYFINPDLLDTEKYKPKGITKASILDSANTWKSHESIPRFEETNKKKAEIRVKFSETESSWTMIGMYAKKLDNKEPTMVLNLFDKGCTALHQINSLIVHMFGRVLGLESQYQHSDFWDVLEKHIDLDKMRADDSVLTVDYSKGKATFRGDWFRRTREPKGASKRRSLTLKKSDMVTASISEYDPKSIMQYRFDKDWLKNSDHGNKFRVEEDAQLSDKEKKYLRGLEERESGMANEPSSAEIETLQKAYCSGFQKSAPEEMEESSSGTPTPLLGDLMNITLDACAQWKSIGKELGLNQDILQSIETDNPGDRYRLNDMYRHWLDCDSTSSRPTWSEVAKALNSPSIGLQEIATKIEDKWIRPYEVVSYSNDVPLSQEDTAVRVVLITVGLKVDEAFSGDSQISVEKFQQFLRKKGQKELADNIISRLNKVAQELKKMSQETYSSM